MASSVRLTEAFLRERERWITGYVATWNTLTQAELETGERCWVNFIRDCFTHLAQRPIVDQTIRLYVNHDENLDVGYWGPFLSDSRGLKGMAVPSDTPAVWELIEAIHDGRATHLSCHADVVLSKERSRPGPHGWPVFDVTEARLREAGPCPEPKDPGAEILTVGGAEPRWLAQDRRTAVLWGLRPPPALVR